MAIKEDLVRRVVEMAIRIQQIPAPTFQEGQRAAFLRDSFVNENLQDVGMDEVGNVFACLPGKGEARPLILSAHLDTVFPASIDLRLTRSGDRLAGPGIGDNSLGVAGLFALVWVLRERGMRLPGDVWLVANVAEEGLGDLKGMRAVVDRFGAQPRAYIVLEGMALGQIYYRGLGVKRYRIRAVAEGGHSWVDYGRPSAIHEIAALIVRLTQVAVPETPRTTLNVGVLSGGTTVNTIAAEASMELDLRSEDSQALTNLAEAVEQLVTNANRPGIRMLGEVIGKRPAGEISPEHPLVQLAARSLASLGMQPVLGIGSTDANIPLSLGLPAICLGLSHGGGAHTLHEFIQTAPLGLGIEQLLMMAEGVFREL